MKVYQLYVDLDKDKDSMLSKEELLNYKWGLTKILIDRVFEESETYEGKMDFNGFLDFHIAEKNIKTKEGIKYFFRIVDVYNKGAIDSFVMNMFLKSIVGKLENQDKQGYKIEYIINEIFDIAKPKVGKAITYDDLISSESGDIIIPMLINAKDFYDYDQRESGIFLDEVEEVQNDF